MNGLQLYLLGRTLMKLGEQAIPPSEFHQLPANVRSVMLDVFEHPNTSVTEIARRTGLPQSHVSASIARLRDVGAFETSTDPRDRRRTLVLMKADVPDRATQVLGASRIDDTLAAVLDTDPRQVTELVALLEKVARQLPPSVTQNKN